MRWTGPRIWETLKVALATGTASYKLTVRLVFW